MAGEADTSTWQYTIKLGLAESEETGKVWVFVIEDDLGEELHTGYGDSPQDAIVEVARVILEVEDEMEAR